MSADVNVCGLVIHVAPAAGPALRDRLAAMTGIDVHAWDGDRLVVTAMDTDEVQALEQIAAINRLPGVVSTSLAYHQVEDGSPSCDCEPGSACCQSQAASADTLARP